MNTKLLLFLVVVHLSFSLSETKISLNKFLERRNSLDGKIRIPNVLLPTTNARSSARRGTFAVESFQIWNEEFKYLSPKEDGTMEEVGVKPEKQYFKGKIEEEDESLVVLAVAPNGDGKKVLIIFLLPNCKSTSKISIFFFHLWRFKSLLSQIIFTFCTLSSPFQNKMCISSKISVSFYFSCIYCQYPLSFPYLVFPPFSSRFRLIEQDTLRCESRTGCRKRWTHFCASWTWRRNAFPWRVLWNWWRCPRKKLPIIRRGMNGKKIKKKITADFLDIFIFFLFLLNLKLSILQPILHYFSKLRISHIF